ncbi:hypothetical protein RUM43_011704 [Polyplax serrata]|uniref:VPS10 domain-containing protein n=1 Tax=Polyplax serrata TaxID=468196 RepID=A0AAN8P5K8_POLSC
MVHWVGVGSDVIICLAKSPRMNVPSSLYISYDYGDTFENKTESFVINDSKRIYASLDKFYIHPTYMDHIVFTDVINGFIFTTTDSGKTLTRIKLPFNPSQISFQADEPLTFLAHDKIKSSRELWSTKDFGQSWTLLQQAVKNFYWSGTSTSPVSVDAPHIIPMKGYKYKNDTGLVLFFERIEPSQKSTVLSRTPGTTGNNVWMTDVEDFKLVGDYMFVIKSASKNYLDLYVSYKQGPFVKAVFPSELSRIDYHMLDVSEGQIFVAVSHTDTLSNLYTSQTMDEKNIFFALSLERILCFSPRATWKGSWLEGVTDESFADFHKVEGLRGIYIASQVQQTANSSVIGPEHLLTLITFDRGGEWRPLTPPPIDDDGLPIKCNANEGCSLHLSQKFSELYPVTRSAPILSSKSAPGIIMATGTIGKSLKGHPKVFLSRDGGLTWRQILKDYYLFNFGDHGGVFVAVKFYRSEAETRELLYSTDEGEKFHSHEFHTEELRVYGLMTQPGGNTTVFTMFGSARGHHQWLIIKVDLRNVFSKYQNICSTRCYHKAPLERPVVIDCTAVGGDECLSCMCPVKNAKRKLFLIKECSNTKYTAEKMKRCRDCQTCKYDLCNGDPSGRPEVIQRPFKKSKVKVKPKSEPFWKWSGVEKRRDVVTRVWV